jgi:hypothetical protein
VIDITPFELIEILLFVLFNKLKDVLARGEIA